MNQTRYEIERNGKICTVNSCNDALGVAREAFPDIRKESLSYVVIDMPRCKETRIRLPKETIYVREYSL